MNDDDIFNLECNVSDFGLKKIKNLGQSISVHNKEKYL